MSEAKNKTNKEGDNLNPKPKERTRTPSAETHRDRLQRTGKKEVCYKETRPYNKKLEIPPFKETKKGTKVSPGKYQTPQSTSIKGDLQKREEEKKLDNDQDDNIFGRSKLTKRSPPNTPNVNTSNSEFFSPENLENSESVRIKNSPSPSEEPEFTEDENSDSSDHSQKTTKASGSLFQDFLTSSTPQKFKNSPLIQENVVPSDLVERISPVERTRRSSADADDLNLLDQFLAPSKKELSQSAPELLSSPMSNPKTNMTLLSEQASKVLKKCPNISAEDSRHDIRENTEKLRNLGNQIVAEDVKAFIEAIAPNFDCEIRDALNNETGLDTIDKICDFVIQKYVLRGNFNEKLKELGDLKKKKSENYAEFGRRIIKFKNDLIKLAGYKTKNEVLVGRKVVIEEVALTTYIKGLKKYLALVYKFGQPNSIEEARRYVEQAENEINFSDDEEELTPKKEVNLIKSNSAEQSKCQRCDNKSHEVFYCPVSACLYCDSTMHKSAECEVVADSLKINIICKECHTNGHTIDRCPKRNDRDSYCQICQAANAHSAANCGTAAKLIKKMSELTDSVEALSLAPINKNPQHFQRQTNSGCYICGDPRHFMRDCRKVMSWNDLERQMGYKPRPNPGPNRGYSSNRGHRQNINWPPTIYGQQPQRGNQQFQSSRTFNRGGRGGHYRGGFRGRGRGNFNWNNPFYNYGNFPTNYEQGNPFMNQGMGWGHNNPNPQWPPRGNQEAMQQATPTFMQQQPQPLALPAAQTIQYANSENGTPLPQ